MREVKEFFNEENSLNKGYFQDKLSTDENLDNKIYHQKLYQNMPPIDIMAAYEDLHPGTLAKLLETMKNEQNHSHMQDLLHIKMNIRAQMIGRIFGLFSIAIIGWVALSLAKDGMMVGGLIFTFISFGAIFATSCALNKNYKSTLPQKYDRKAVIGIDGAKPIDQKPFNKNYKNRRRHVKPKGV